MKRTVTKVVFPFDELSENARTIATERFNPHLNDMSNDWSSENFNTLKTFLSMLPADYREAQYDGINASVDYKLHQDEEILQLSGPRLMAYLYNNYFTDIP